MTAQGTVEEAYSRFVSREFRHHNPYFLKDLAALQEGMKESASRVPDKTLVIEENDLVALLSRVTGEGRMPEMALVHVLRFAGDRIIEL
jgi:hypothetical protein